MPGAIFGKCGEYMKLDRDKSTFKSHRVVLCQEKGLLK